MTDSWLEHRHQHARVTRADRVLEQAVGRYQIGEAPKTTHLIAVQPEN
jgi:Transmembrane secretion effector